MTLRVLFLVHAIITLAAGIVLIVAPALIPGTVEMSLTKEQYLLSYFLAASEIAIAWLSFFSRNSSDVKLLRLAASTIIVFHLSTAVLEVYALSTGNVNGKIIGNVVLRVIITILFVYYGYYKNREKLPAGK
jgi:hypothetical protein